MNIVLIGYRGTGKSAVAEALGQQMGRPVVSTDAEIVRREKRSIPEIVAEHGWEHFREVEEAVVAEVAQSEDAIIDCGGGVVTRPANVTNLRAHGTVVWLSAPVPVIAARIASDDQRPSLTGEADFVAEIAAVLEERAPLYRAAADIEVDTSTGSPEEIAKIIAQRIEIA